MAEPRRLNFVTLLLCAGLAAGGYWMWKFFPVYWTGWQVDHLLAEAGAETYQIARMQSPERERRKLQIEEQTRDKVAALGIDDPELKVAIAIEGDSATVTADYEAVVKHPIGGKQSVITLHRSAVTDLKRVRW